MAAANRWFALLLLFVLPAWMASGCGDTQRGRAEDVPETTSAPGATPTVTASDPVVIARIQQGDLGELSGIVASRVHPGIFWAHNDSGDTPRVFAIDANGAPRGTFRLAGAAAEDWEDIALGPGPEPGKSYLYAGDIGDNFDQRARVVIYRIPEPDPGTAGEVAIPGAEALELRYPDGEGHNAEAMAVDPANGDVYIFAKKLLGPSPVYRAKGPLEAGAPVTLEQVASVRLFGPATGADIAPDRSAIIIRTYTDAYLWPLAENEDIAKALGGEPQRIRLQPERQGEAIAFTADSAAFVTSSEGAHAAINRYALP
ncbi:MAG: hypothetical protein ACM3S1_03045 [Hyphomicrobiales bacterium]